MNAYEVEELSGSDQKGEVLAGPSVEFPRTVHPQLAKVMLVMPWMKMTNPMTAFCLMGLVDRRRTSLLLNYGDAFVAHARNKCAEIFLKSNVEWMLTVDDDMIVPFGNASWFNAHTGWNLPEQFASMNAMDRLLSHGKTLIGALYFGRHKYGPPLYNEGINNGTEAAYSRKAPFDQIKPTNWVATGCLLIHRSVFLDIEKKFPRLARKPDGTGGNWFSTSEHKIMERVDRARAIFSDKGLNANTAHEVFSILESAASEGRHQSSLGMGEDVQFCVRAREAGHQPWVDMGLVCGHVGACCYGPKNTFPKP